MTTPKRAKKEPAEALGCASSKHRAVLHLGIGRCFASASSGASPRHRAVLHLGIGRCFANEKDVMVKVVVNLINKENK